MPYLLLSIELLATALLFFLRTRQYNAKKLLINPSNTPIDSHNLIKSGKAKRLNRERQKYINTIALILGIGAVAISGTLFWHFNQKVKQHRKDGKLSLVLPCSDLSENHLV